MKNAMDFLKSHNVLDVTFRDGGFLNNWDFSEQEMLSVLKSLDKVGVEMIEVGYLSEDPTLKLAARCPASFLETLKAETHHAGLAGMLRCFDTQIDRTLDSRKDFLDLIRIVVSNKTEIRLAVGIAEKVKKAGLMCSLNFANFSLYSLEELVATVKMAAHSKELFDIFYFADSRGAAYPNEVYAAIKAIKETCGGVLAFHAHDMMGLAAANSHAAVAAGCTMIDGSIKGYGLGAGNTQLQHALAIMESFQKDRHYDYSMLRNAAQMIDLPTNPEQSYLQYLGGKKNLSGLWIEPLIEHFGEGTISFLHQLPRKPYKTLEEVLRADLVSFTEN
jgi:4-hydroxy 2-oxovalerate aldolase